MELHVNLTVLPPFCHCFASVLPVFFRCGSKISISVRTLSTSATQENLIFKSQIQNPRTDIECPLGKTQIVIAHISPLGKTHFLSGLYAAWENSFSISKTQIQIPNGISDSSVLFDSSSCTKPFASSPLRCKPMKYREILSFVSVKPLFLSAL